MWLPECTETEGVFAFGSYQTQSHRMGKRPPSEGIRSSPYILAMTASLMGGFTMSKEIPLTQGKVAIVDDADYEWLSQWKWQYHYGYARRTAGPRLKPKRIYMHRIVLNPRPGMESDHIIGDGLDNRRCNLRVCTRSQNNMNAKKQVGSSSRYKGVSWYKSRHRWEAYIKIKGE